jgi:hypothetical protein
MKNDSNYKQMFGMLEKLFATSKSDIKAKRVLKILNLLVSSAEYIKNI